MYLIALRTRFAMTLVSTPALHAADPVGTGDTFRC